MKPTECHEILDLVERAARGTLHLEDRARFERHVAACRRCADRLADARASIEFLAASPRPACPPRVVDVILARAMEESQAAAVHAAPIERARRVLSWPRTWRLAPALGLAATLLLVLWTQRPAPSPSVADGPSATTGDRVNGMQAVEAARETRVALRILAGALQHASETANEEVGAGLARPVLRGLVESIDRLPAPFDGMTTRTAETDRT
jgi:hypothetical protein